MSWAIQIAFSTKSMNEHLEFKFGTYAIERNLIDFLFPLISAKSQRRLFPLIIFSSPTERQKFMTQNKMLNQEEYLAQSRRFKGSQKAYYLLLAGKMEEAVESGLVEIRKIFQSQVFDFSALEDSAEFISSLRFDSPCPVFNEVVSISFYIAIYRAFWKGFYQILSLLYDRFEFLVRNGQFAYLIERIPEVHKVLCYGLAQKNLEAGRDFAQTRQISNLTYLESFQENVEIESAVIMKSSSTFNQILLFLSAGDPSICESKTELNEAPSVTDPCISTDEALMWFDVTPFSPFTPYPRLFPF